MQISNSGYRSQFIKLKTAKKRKPSSNKWLQRQLNDTYVAKSKIDGYRSRAAYKLLEINQKFQIFKPGDRVIDLGAAPGGWSQVAVKLTKTKQHKNTVLALDLLKIDPIEGVIDIQGDFLDSLILTKIQERGLNCNIVLSDMAANTTGHHTTDHLRTMLLCEQAFEFAIKVLEPGGHFISKVFQGGTENKLLTQIKMHFDLVKHFKPAASRKESSEFYLIALNRKNCLS